MAIAKGVSKIVAYKKETTWGTLAGATGASQLRRVTANFNLTKETYESNEIRTDYQVADMRHGVRTSEGSLNGELSPRTYSDFMASVVARDFAAVAGVSSVSLTISASGDKWNLSRSSGDFLADGIQVGQIIRLTGFDTANNNKNLLVASVSASDVMVFVVNASSMTAEGPVTGDISVVGKSTYAPLTNHTNDSFTIEEWYGDILQSEVYTGMKVGTMNVQLPATGLVTTDFSLMGKDLYQTGTTQYFSSPSAQGTEGIFSAVNGLLLVNGEAVGLITSADFSVDRAMENATVVGSNSVADVFTGRIRVTGNFSTYFQDATFRDYFNNENTVSLVMLVTTDSSADSDFISFVIPKIKVGSATKDDGENGIVQQHSFTAILNDVTSGGLPQTTISIQDSAA